MTIDNLTADIVDFTAGGLLLLLDDPLNRSSRHLLPLLLLQLGLDTNRCLLTLHNPIQLLWPPLPLLNRHFFPR